MKMFILFIGFVVGLYSNCITETRMTHVEKSSCYFYSMKDDYKEIEKYTKKRNTEALYGSSATTLSKKLKSVYRTGVSMTLKRSEQHHQYTSTVKDIGRKAGIISAQKGYMQELDLEIAQTISAKAQQESKDSIEKFILKHLSTKKSTVKNESN